MIEVFLLLIIVILLAWKFFVFKRPPNFPPGPIFRVPFYQQRMYLNGEDRIGKQKKLRQKYGDVFSLELGTYATIVVSELNIMKKLLNNESFSHRLEISHPPSRLSLMKQLRGYNGVGLVASSGKTWKEQRRFALKNLRDFGLGKQSMEALIMDEVNELSEKWKNDLKINEEQTINWKTFNMSILNALWGIVSSRRFDLNNVEEIKKFEVMNALFNSFGGFSLRTLIAFSLPAFLRKYNTEFKTMFDRQHYLYDWFAKEYEAHLKTYDENNLRDYIDCYIQERQRAEREEDKDSSFYGEKGHWSFVNTMLDLFVAGAETTSSTLQWALAYLVHHPDVQSRAQQELDEIVGRARLPTLEDRDKLPYMESLIAEIQRCGNVAPFALFHCVDRDVEVDGFIYTKHSRIMPDLTSILSDPNNFDYPDQFNPERFLCKETGKFISHPALVMFGVGKRECLGKSLAKIELYLFLVGLLHQFSFYPSEEGLPDLNNANVNITRVPKPFKIKIVSRKV